MPSLLTHKPLKTQRQTPYTLTLGSSKREPFPSAVAQPSIVGPGRSWGKEKEQGSKSSSFPAVPTAGMSKTSPSRPTMLRFATWGPALLSHFQTTANRKRTRKLNKGAERSLARAFVWLSNFSSPYSKDCVVTVQYVEQVSVALLCLPRNKGLSPTEF